MKRTLLVFLLAAVCAASLFMIVESGDYYSTFYKNSYQGYWAAFLVEAFLAISAMLHFVKRPRLNMAVKLAMIPLFLVVVGGASLKVAAPLFDKLADAENRSRLVEFLAQENRQSQKSLALVSGQKVNTALAVRHQREISRDLKSELRKKKSLSWTIWIAIGFSTFLRLAVQLANLILAHCLGVVYRETFGNRGRRAGKVGRPRKKRKYTKRTDKPAVKSALKAVGSLS